MNSDLYDYIARTLGLGHLWFIGYFAVYSKATLSLESLFTHTCPQGFFSLENLQLTTSITEKMIFSHPSCFLSSFYSYILLGKWLPSTWGCLALGSLACRLSLAPTAAGVYQDPKHVLFSPRLTEKVAWYYLPLPLVKPILIGSLASPLSSTLFISDLCWNSMSCSSLRTAGAGPGDILSYRDAENRWDQPRSIFIWVY